MASLHAHPPVDVYFSSLRSIPAPTLSIHPPLLPEHMATANPHRWIEVSRANWKQRNIGTKHFNAALSVYILCYHEIDKGEKSFPSPKCQTCVIEMLARGCLCLHHRPGCGE